jgi:hypothetical protein
MPGMLIASVGFQEDDNPVIIDDLPMGGGSSSPGFGYAPKAPMSTTPGSQGQGQTSRNLGNNPQTPPPNPGRPSVSVPNNYRSNQNGRINNEPQFDVTRPLRNKPQDDWQGWTGGQRDFMRSRPAPMKSADPAQYKNSQPSNQAPKPVQPEILGLPKPGNGTPNRAPLPTNPPGNSAKPTEKPWTGNPFDPSVNPLTDLFKNPNSGNANPSNAESGGFDQFFEPRIPKPTAGNTNPTPSPVPTPTPNPDPNQPDGEYNLGLPPDVFYKVITNYKYRSVSETVWVDGKPRFRHLRWDIEGRGEQNFQTPFILEWKQANPVVSANYLNPPSPYQWFRLRHKTGTYELTGNSSSYFSTADWSYQRLDQPTSEPTQGTTPNEVTIPAPTPEPPPQINIPTQRGGRGWQSAQPPKVGIPTNIPANPPKPGQTNKKNDKKIGLPVPIPNKPDKSNPNSPSQPDKGKTPSGVPFPPSANSPGKNPANTPTKTPSPAKSPCVPPGQFEEMSCNYKPTEGQKIDEILKRIGKPKNADGLTGIIGDDKPRHPITKLPTNLTSLVKGNWWLNALNAVFAPLNFAANIHNAFMLSADIKETIGSFMSVTLDVVRTTLSLKDPDDAMIDINDVVNKNFESLMDNLLGASNWELIKQRAAAVNRIYMAQTNAMYAVKNAFDSVFESMGTIGQYTGKIGNALKKAQVVYEDAYDWMDEERANEQARIGRFGNLTGRLEGVEDAANMLLAIASSVKEVQEGAKELADSLTEYENAKAEAYTKWSEAYGNKIRNQKETQAPDAIAEVELKTFDFEDN